MLGSLVILEAVYSFIKAPWAYFILGLPLNVGQNLGNLGRLWRPFGHQKVAIMAIFTDFDLQ